jgi:outer membrane protein assembly factor BamB
VTVSDGKNMTVTDNQGKYELVVETNRRVSDIVFVTTPSGYTVATDESKTPQFYKQLGTLQNNETREQDFALIHAPETSNPNFNFVNIADVHVEAGTTNNKERFTEQLKQINETTGNPAFIAVSGDLTNRATDAEFEDYTAATSTSELPIYPAVGNHDFTAGNGYGARIDNYRSYLGPEWYSFDYGNRHFVVLENTLGFSEDDQLEWLKQDLAHNADKKEVIVFVHKPLNTPQTPSSDQTNKFIDVLSQYQTRLVMVGHTHVNDVDQDTIPGANHVTTVSSSYTIDQMPNGFRVIDFQGGKQENDFKMYGVEESAAIVSPAAGSKVPQGEVDIVVNAYNTTSTVKRVEYRVDGSEWMPLKQSSGFSWYGQWKGKNAQIGQHAVEVRVTDDAGSVWSKNHTFNVIAPSEAVAPQAGSNWDMFHGNAQHTGQTADILDAGLNLNWTYRTPGTILTSSPAIVDERVYIGTRDESGTEENAIHAVNLQTGEQVWRVQADAMVQSSPAVQDGIVYASSIRGTLYAINAQNGQILWTKQVNKDDVRRAWMYYSPTVANGVVYQAYSTSSGGKLMALNATTGEELWQSPLAGNWIVESSPVVADGKVYVSGDGGNMFAFDAASGKKLWQAKPAGGWMHSMPMIAEGKVYMGYGGGILVALDAETGKEIWRHKSSDSSYIHGGTTGSTAAYANGTVYMGFPDGNIAAFDAKTGSVKWKHRTNGGIISSAAISGETVFIGSNDGHLYALDSLTGQPLWQHEIGTWVASSPAISGNTLVVGALDGNLYAYTPGGEDEARWNRINGSVTDSTTGEPVSGAVITVFNEQGEKVKSSNTDSSGNYLTALEPGKYTLHISRLGYQTHIKEFELTADETEKIDAVLTAVNVDASYGKKISGPTSQGTFEDIVIENNKLAMTVADISNDGQLPGVTKGKVLDIAAAGMQDQIDWINLPYASKNKPSGTEAWQQLTVKTDALKILEVTPERSVVQAKGASTEVPGVEVTTNYIIEADQEWITAQTTYSNTGNDAQTFWIGDAIDYDGSGQRSAAGSNEVISLPYAEPKAFTLNEPWIGMTGNDNQMIGLVYEGDTNGMGAYGNGNWIMSQKQIDLPAGKTYTFERKIVAAKGQQSNDFSILSRIAQQ